MIPERHNLLNALTVFLVAMVLSACAPGTSSNTTTTADGLVVEDLVAGEGEEAGTGSAVAVHYTGWLYDETRPDNRGDEFDTSYKRNRPFEFVLGQGRVIKGWDLGVVGMKVGGKRRLVIPSELGYGERGSRSIPPNSTLMFDVELLATDSVEIIEQKIGDGDEAVAGARVYVDYTGWLFDADGVANKGVKFDSSIDRGDKFDFELGRGKVITGWDVGVQGMKVGGKRTLIIPASMAYGARGQGNLIPPNADLVFDVELFEVKGGPAQ